MTLTPEHVHKKTFTPVRLREGYDMGEVDQFLDEVETELTRLHQENDELRAKLAAASTAAPTTTTQTPEPETAVEETTVEETTVEPPEPVFEASTPELPAVRTVPEASSAAARLLEIAANNADQLVAEAQGEADRVVGEARTKAERLEADSRAKADRVESDAHTRAEKLDSETSERRQQMFGQLERDRDNLSRELDELRTFEREYRSRLKSYFEGQLRALDGQDEGAVPLTPSNDGETPRRLRELLGEDSQQ